MKLIALLLVAIAGAALADSWRTEPVSVTTNQMTVTLGDEYRTGCRFDGYWASPTASATTTNVFTVSLTRGQYTWFTKSDTVTNEALRVSGLDLPVAYGDVLTITNDLTTGKAYLHFRME